MDAVAESALVIEGLRAGYGDSVIVDNASIAIPAKQIVLVVGRNGSGKSTFLKAAFGLAQIHAGSVHVAGRDVTHASIPKRIAAGLRYVPQVGGVFPSMRVEENLRLGARAGGVDAKKAVDEMLSIFPTLRDMLPQRAGQLSGGQQRLVSLAMGLITKPQFLLIDEPSAGLSPRMVGDVLGHLTLVRDSVGTGILLVEQNVREACAIADHVHVFRDGRPAWQGSPSELLSQPTLAAFL